MVKSEYAGAEQLGEQGSESSTQVIKGAAWEAYGSKFNIALGATKRTGLQYRGGLENNVCRQACLQPLLVYVWSWSFGLRLALAKGSLELWPITRRPASAEECMSLLIG